MGGPGTGHKSWRSGLESRVIEQLVWQWWRQKTEAVGWHPGGQGRFGGAQGKRKGQMAALRLARMLGVSHTWVNKLAKKFEADPDQARRRNGAFAPATLATLERAREETRWHREHGRLRGPMPRRR